MVRTSTEFQRLNKERIKELYDRMEQLARQNEETRRSAAAHVGG
ncbi:MAG: hypothetical protein WBR13_13300 [Allosphingosinicella sp.]